MNVTLQELQKLLSSPLSPDPQVFVIDSVHVSAMAVVEGGTSAQMKQCLLKLPLSSVWAHGTYAFDSDLSWRFTGYATVSSRVFPLGVVRAVPTKVPFYLDTEMTVVKSRKVEGREHTYRLNVADFRMEES